MELNGVPQSKWVSVDCFIINKCAESSCPCVRILLEYDHRDHGIYPLLDEYTMMLSCENINCTTNVHACNVHAPLHLVHTSDDFWLCRQCYDTLGGAYSRYFRMWDTKCDKYTPDMEDDYDYQPSKTLCTNECCSKDKLGRRLPSLLDSPSIGRVHYDAFK